MAIQAFIWDRYNQPEQREVFTKATLENIESLPGVEAAGVTTAIPLLESSQTSSGLLLWKENRRRNQEKSQSDNSQLPQPLTSTPSALDCYREGFLISLTLKTLRELF